MRGDELGQGILNTLRPRWKGQNFADDIFKCIFVNEKGCIVNKLSLKIVPKGSINNIPALVQKMAWRRSGDKPLSEPMMVRLLTDICVTQPQWVNTFEWSQLMHVTGNSLHAKLFSININMFLKCLSFLHIGMTVGPHVRQGLPSLYCQYHGCWCPGDVKSNHDTDLVKLG